MFGVARQQTDSERRLEASNEDHPPDTDVAVLHVEPAWIWNKTDMPTPTISSTKVSCSKGEKRRNNY